MAVSPSEDTLGLLTLDKRMLTYNLGSVDATNVGALLAWVQAIDTKTRDVLNGIPIVADAR